MPFYEIPAVSDAYVDQAAPDSNFGTDVELHVRSEEGANTRTFLVFDLDQLPANFDAYEDGAINIEVADNPAVERTVELHEVDAAFEEGTLTWNNQPAPVEAWGSDTTGGSRVRFDISSILIFRELTSGTIYLRVNDETEGATLAAELAMHSRETTTPPVLSGDYVAAEARVLASSLVVRQADSVDLGAGVLPRIPADADLASGLDVVFVEDLVATVTPTLIPLEVRARVQGIVTRLLVDPFDDFRRITDEVGSKVTRVQDGTTVELRRIVQVVAAGTPAFSLSETPTFPGSDTGSPDTLRRGDAMLFAVGDERWEPGTRVTWRGQVFEVAGVLGVERVMDEVLYQEVGLRRVPVVARARVVGVVG